MRRTIPRPAAGFTLLEVLLATTLLAAGLALGFATVRAAGATVTRGEAMAARNERIRAVSAFMRHRIGGIAIMGHAAHDGDGTGQLVAFAAPDHGAPGLSGHR